MSVAEVNFQTIFSFFDRLRAIISVSLHKIVQNVAKARTKPDFYRLHHSIESNGTSEFRLAHFDRNVVMVKS